MQNGSRTAGAAALTFLFIFFFFENANNDANDEKQEGAERGE